MCNCVCTWNFIYFVPASATVFAIQYESVCNYVNMGDGTSTCISDSASICVSNGICTRNYTCMDNVSAMVPAPQTLSVVPSAIAASAMASASAMVSAAGMASAFVSEIVHASALASAKVYLQWYLSPAKCCSSTFSASAMPSPTVSASAAIVPSGMTPASAMVFAWYLHL